MIARAPGSTRIDSSSSTSKIIAALWLDANRRTAGTLRRSTRNRPAVSRSTMAPPTSSESAGAIIGQVAFAMQPARAPTIDVSWASGGSTSNEISLAPRGANRTVRGAKVNCTSLPLVMDASTNMRPERHATIAESTPSAWAAAAVSTSSLRRQRCCVRRSRSILMSRVRSLRRGFLHGEAGGSRLAFR